jgi:ankyrin repeat protein
MIILSDWMVLEANTRNEKKLIDAIASSEVEKIDKLLRKIRDINYQDRRGRTFLTWAVATLNPDTVNAILAKGPDISLADDEGKTALDHAMENPDVRIREAIIAAIN